MSETFDPYLRWLGIRDPQRPPNHYRLLGLELFESDPEIISEAADRQMGHVRTHQTGVYALESQTLLNELARAKVCLLNSSRRLEYNKNLEALLNGASPAASPSAEPSTPPPAVRSAPQTSASSSPVQPTSSRSGPKWLRETEAYRNGDLLNPAEAMTTEGLRPDDLRIEENELPTEDSAAASSAPSSQRGPLGRRISGGDTPTEKNQEAGLKGSETKGSETKGDAPRPDGLVKGMVVKLLVQSGPMSGQSFEFGGRETFTVGRSKRASFPVRGDQAFSRVHFSIRLAPPVCYLKNLNDKQGTKVNGKPVSETLLRHGDVISGGLHTRLLVQFAWPASAAPANAAPASVEPASADPASDSPTVKAAPTRAASGTLAEPELDVPETESASVDFDGPLDSA